jgi:hypothetical protein
MFAPFDLYKHSCDKDGENTLVVLMTFTDVTKATRWLQQAADVSSEFPSLSYPNALKKLIVNLIIAFV